MEWRFSQVFGEGRPQVDEVVDGKNNKLNIYFF